MFASSRCTAEGSSWGLAFSYVTRCHVRQPNLMQRNVARCNVNRKSDSIRSIRHHHPEGVVYRGYLSQFWCGRSLDYHLQQEVVVYRISLPKNVPQILCILPYVWLMHRFRRKHPRFSCHTCHTRCRECRARCHRHCACRHEVYRESL